MRLYLLPDTFREDSPLVLKGKDYNYIINVLRLKERDRLTGRDKAGRPWELTIETVGPSSCTLTAARTENAGETTDALPSCRPQKNIVLYQCLPKGRKMDDIIRMATEAGVLRIVPVKSRYCVADISSKEKNKLERYSAVVREAVQQSGSLVPTEVENAIDIKDVPQHFKKLCSSLGQSGTGLFFHQKPVHEEQKTLPQVLKDFDGTTGILIGSEGGLAEEEIKALEDGGFTPVLLKTNILRCETAAIYALSAVQTLVE